MTDQVFNLMQRCANKTCKAYFYDIIRRSAFTAHFTDYYTPWIKCLPFLLTGINRLYENMKTELLWHFPNNVCTHPMQNQEKTKKLSYDVASNKSYFT